MNSLYHSLHLFTTITHQSSRLARREYDPGFRLVPDPAPVVASARVIPERSSFLQIPSVPLHHQALSYKLQGGFQLQVVLFALEGHPVVQLILGVGRSSASPRVVVRHVVGQVLARGGHLPRVDDLAVAGYVLAQGVQT